MSNYEKLKDQPLVIALAEFRFSTVLAMGNYISDFQDYLRQDFPFFSKIETQEMTFSSNGVELTTLDGWLFLSSDKKRAFKLDKDRITFMTSEYDRFPSFWEDCKTALLFIEDKIKPSLLLRIGLRYSDLIIGKNEDDVIEEYVHSSICNDGKLTAIGEQFHHTKETGLQTQDGYMVVRSFYGMSDLSAWHDLSDPPIVIKKHQVRTKRILLDFDHFWMPESKNIKFAVDFIENKINALHNKSRQAFWETTTQQGRRRWK